MTMDRDLGFCGILRKVFHIISSEKKLLSIFSALFILPIALILIVQYSASLILYNSIAQNAGSQLSVALLVLVNLVCVVLEVSFALLTYGAVVFTASCSYTGKLVSFHKVTRSLCQIWKRLVVTCLWCILILIVYSLIAGIVLVLFAIFVLGNTVGLVVFVVLLVLYAIGSIYLNLLFGMAYTVSVLEDAYGRESISRGKNLLRGKLVVAGSLYVFVVLCAMVIQLIFSGFTVLGSGNVGLVILQTVVSFLVTIMIILVIEVIQTVLYFVCKHHHGDAIDEAVLSSHLDHYMGLYSPLRSDDTQDA